jgi:hypothetical protein
MNRPVKLTTISMGDVDDLAIYAGFAIASWQKTEQAVALEKLNIKPTMWKSGPAHYDYSVTIDVWCEEYNAEDMALARLCGLVDLPYRTPIVI